MADISETMRNYPQYARKMRMAFSNLLFAFKREGVLGSSGLQESIIRGILDQPERACEIAGTISNQFYSNDQKLEEDEVDRILVKFKGEGKVNDRFLELTTRWLEMKKDMRVVRIDESGQMPKSTRRLF